MKCPKCGRELPYGSKYCMFCDISVKNDELDDIDRTRVIPEINKSPKKPTHSKPKLKPEKKRQLILVYSSMAIIILFIILIFVVLFNSCSGAKKKDPGYHFSSEFTSTESSLSNTSSDDVTSAVTSSDIVSGDTSSDDTSSGDTSSEFVPVVRRGINYIGVTFATLKSELGEPSLIENENYEKVVVFENYPGEFYFFTDELSDIDTVYKVLVREGDVMNGITIGNSYNECKLILNNYGPTQFKEEDGEYYTDLEFSDGKKIVIYFDGAEREEDLQDSPSLAAYISE